MTSNRAQLQALIDQLDSALSASTPESQAQQQEALAQTRRYLIDLQRQGIDSQEASAQQVLQAVVQEMGYLRANMIQPLREEIAQLHDERRLLASDVHQLQQQQQQIKASQQQAMQQQMLQDFMQSLMARLQDQMTTQVVQAIALMQPQLPSGDSAGDGAPLDAQQVAQLRALQATSNELMLKMDSTMRVVFDSLQSTVDSYRDSLGQGLEKMHSLGQQGEALFAALVNRLATQLGQEASHYLNRALSQEEQRRLGDAAATDRLLSRPQGELADIANGPAEGLDVAGETDAPEPEALSVEEIDQLLRQNLAQAEALSPVEAEPFESPSARASQEGASLNPDDLIDQILNELEADLDAIGTGLNLDLNAIDLAPATAPAADDSLDKAMALFELGEEGVVVHESEAPAPEGGAASEGDEIAASYAAFRAATDTVFEDEDALSAASGDRGQTDDGGNDDTAIAGLGSIDASPEGSADFEDVNYGPGPDLEGPGPDPGPDPNKTSDERASASIDTISRLSDLIDPNLLIQMGMADISGSSSSFTMASLGEDLLPTVSDSTKPSTQFNIDIDQLAADLSRVEGLDPETVDEVALEASVSGFLSPDDDFFSIDKLHNRDAATLSALNRDPETNPEILTESGETLSEAAGETPLDQSQADTSELDAPTPLGPFSGLPSASTSPDADADVEAASPADSESTFGSREDPDPFADNDTTIDEIAALFAALEGTEDNPANIAEQTLADLLKPDGSDGPPLSPPAADRNPTEMNNDEKKK
ncbi:MAG: hypothetical protein ACFB5Z_03460 [Elainellaceae cyanobacterium]